MIARLLVILSIYCLCFPAHADDYSEEGGNSDESAPEQSQPLSISEFASQFVVLVRNNVSNIFTPQIGGGHGTGFIVEIDEERGKGVAFTNRHVIDSYALDTQQIVLEFSTDTDIPESLPASLIYASHVHDFAVLEFDLDKLVRVKDQILPALIPVDNELLYDFKKNHRQLQGRETIALGNPLESTGISTHGRINGINNDLYDGPFIQTQTPINPGNSGGPLVDIETGAVVGINTAIIDGANSVGFAIPIKSVLEEYVRWRSQPDIVTRKELGVGLQISTKMNMDSLGLTEIIENEVGDYFINHTEAIQIRDAQESTGLRSGDHIITMDGQIPGGSIYEFRKILRFIESGKTSIEIKVVRDGKVVTVNTPVHSSRLSRTKRELDFIYLSGLVLREVSNVEAWSSDKELISQVVVDWVDQSQEVMFGVSQFPEVGSFVVGITVNNKKYDIKNLFELKEILNHNASHEVVVLHVREAMSLPTKDGKVLSLTTYQGAPALDSLITNLTLPLHKLVTPMQFSIHQFKKQFRFDKSGYETRDWTAFIRNESQASARAASLCEDAIDSGSGSESGKESI